MKSTFDRSYAEDVLPKKLDNYMKEFEQDVSLSEMNIRDKTFLRASLAAKWCRYEYEEKRFKEKIFAVIEELKSKEAAKLFEKKKNALLGQNSNEFLLKAEVDKIIKKSSAYQSLKESIDEQEDVLRFIAECKQIISQFGFDIKNAIDLLKLENG